MNNHGSNKYELKASATTCVINLYTGSPSITDALISVYLECIYGNEQRVITVYRNAFVSELHRNTIIYVRIRVFIIALRLFTCIHIRICYGKVYVFTLCDALLPLKATQGKLRSLVTSMCK